jgi:hypothetical protein
MVGSKLMAFLAVSLLLPAIGVPSARAQSIWLPRDRSHGVLLEILHNRLEYWDSDFPTGSVYLGARFAVSQTVAIVGEVPYTRAVATDDFYFGELTVVSGETIGNPYLGIEINPSGSDFFVELGARAPLMGKDEPDDIAFHGPGFVASRADQGRFDAFAASTVPIHLVFNVRHVTDAGLLTRLRFGPVLAIPTENEDVREIELHASYGWQIGYEGKGVRVGGAITGQSLLTTIYETLGKRTRTQFEFHADFGNWTIRPGLDIRLPIGTYADVVSVAYGGFHRRLVLGSRCADDD